MNRTVEIYTRTYCAYCERAKELLRIKSVPFVEHNITNDPLKAADLLALGYHQAPPAVFAGALLIGSCTELFDLDERGELDGLLDLQSPLVQPTP